MKRITSRRPDRFLFKRRLISVAVMSAVSGHLNANPTGPQVVNGQVSVTTQGSVLTVTNTPNAIVNWQSFSIGGHETTRFVQQSASSAVLNRVVGVDPSVILGTLQSNGKVLLINTNGIVFGQGARVDVAGLVASTLNLNDQDFLAGRLNFQSSPLGSGSVVNRGTIAIPEGGSVFLVGAAVENGGIIHAPGGEVILAAGQSVRLGSTGAPNVLVEVEAPANRAVNLGEIAVGAGKAGIYGGFVEQKGIVSANTASVNAAGKIVFKATRDTAVAAGSTTTASGAQGGTIAVESGGTTRVDGVVSATGASGKGGTIHLTGPQVAVAGAASVDASGAAGGGTILVGGDYKGANREVRNARATFVGGDTQLRADATSAGDGGRIIVWSDEVTRAYGNISARGGPLGGDGGFVETSSHSFLSVLNAPDIAAPLGRGGTWLLDPYNITVIAGAAGSQPLDLFAPNFLANADNSTVSNTAIQNALNAGGVVIIDTGGTGVGTQAGDITVDAPIAMTGSAPATLQFLAANNIYLTANAAIGSTAGALRVVLNSDRDSSGAGAVWLQPGSSITTNGGDLTIGGGDTPLATPARASADILEGVRLEGATISAGAGKISILGAGPGNGVSIIEGGGRPVSISTSTGNVVITATQGNVVVQGQSAFADVISSQGDVILSAAGIMTFNHSHITAGRNIEFYVDDFQDFDTTFTSGPLDPDYFRWAPWTPGVSITIDLQAQANVSRRLQVGNPSGTTFGAVTIAGTVEATNFSPVTNALEVYADAISVEAFLGSATPLPLSLTARAKGDITVGTAAGATIRLGDARTLSLVADADADGIGNLIIGTNAGAYANIAVGIPGSSTTSSMELRGANVTFQGNQNVWLYGPGTQTIAATQDVRLSISGPDLNYLSVGSAGLTDVTAGNDLIIQSLGDGVAQIAGDFSAPGGLGAVHIAVGGDLRMSNSASANSAAYIFSQKGATIQARALQLVGAAGGFNVGIDGQQSTQTITTTGSGPNGWGIELTNFGSHDSNGFGGIYLSTEASQQITASNGGGILLNNQGGPVFVNGGGYWDNSVTPNVFVPVGEQRITADGGGANAIRLQGGPGEVSIQGGVQTITAGTGTNLGSITLLGGSVGHSSAGIYSQGATQTIATTGEVRVIAGSAPDAGQGNKRCDLQACANIGLLLPGAAQTVTAGSIVMEGGSGGGRNESNIFSFGAQTVNAAGGISITGGAGSGTGNWASLYGQVTQQVNFGSGTITLQSSAGSGDAGAPTIYSDGAQTIFGSGDIVMVGGVANQQAWAEIHAGTSQDITARSISITATAGTGSTGIYTPTGLQRITTTGASANGYGITIRNLGAKGTDQNGSPAVGYIYDRAGIQIIDVANSNGILLAGIGGDTFLGTDGASQTITIHGGGTNRLDLNAGLGIAVVSHGNGTFQSIEAGSVTLAGGTANGAFAEIQALAGTQTIALAGALTLTGGSAPGPASPPLSNPDSIDCTGVSGCALVVARAGQQTITANAISVTGGSAGTENLATIRGDAGQSITTESGGVTLQGGSGAGWRNYAWIESRSGDQILTFASGALLSLTGGTVGSKHFAAIEAIGSTISQQILGNPVITLTGGANGGGDGTGSFATFLGNNAAIVTDPGTPTSQTINAQSITMQGGGGRDNNAHIGVWGAAPQTITVVGDLRMHGGTAPGAQADLIALGAQTISARSLEMIGTAGGATAALYTQGTGTQTITTTGASGNGWGIELVNNGPGDGQDVYIQSNASQHIEALNGGGILLNAAGRSATIRGGLTFNVDHWESSGTQTIRLDGTGANRLELRGGAGGALIEGSNQSITAGTTGQGSIQLQGSALNYGGAYIVSQVGSQAISSSGQLALVAGSAPDAGQGMYQCWMGGACAQVLALQNGVAVGTLLQDIAADSVVVRAGSAGAYNHGEIYSSGSQRVTVTGAGGITIQGGAGTGNFAQIAMGGGPGYLQTIAFGSGDLNILGGTSGGRSDAQIGAPGNQSITGTGNITVRGGVLPSVGAPAKFYNPSAPNADANGYVVDPVVWSSAVIAGNTAGDPVGTQTITANSLSIIALPSQSSTGIFSPEGVQTVSTAGGDVDGYGLTVRNLGAVGGPEQGGFGRAAAFITNNGEQVIDVANSLGLRLLGDNGFAIINAGQLEGAVNLPATSQRITVHGSGANAILLTAGAGQAQLYSYSNGSQTVTAGLAGETGSITLQGGAQSGAVANITADRGTQTVRTTGLLSLTGGTAAELAPINFDQKDCLPACASLYSGAGQQTIDADAIVIRGGASGSENLASIYSNSGQAVTVHGAGGLQILGGGESGASTNHSNFAILENYGGSQVITFLTPGAPLTIDAGDVGQRHFAGLYNGGANTNGQQILGDPTIAVKAGTGGSGAGSPNRFELTSNFAFLASESGDQVIHATSITLQGGATDSNSADLLNWGGSMSGSVLGSQIITTIGGLTLQGGAGANANARLYSHSGSQAIDVGGALTMTRAAGGGDVFLGNVFDPGAANIGVNAVDIAVAGGLQLQGGNIWGDDGITLHLAGSSSVTGGMIHSGVASAPTTAGDIVVDPGTYVTLNGSLNTAGKFLVGGSNGLFELIGGTLTIGQDITNSGILRLRTSTADTAAALIAAGQLVNAPGGVLQSLTEGGTSPNAISSAVVVNQGVLDIGHTLTISNTSRTFDTRTGTLNIASTEALEVANGTAQIASTTGRGLGSGKLALQGTVTLLLDDNVTLAPTGFQLGLGGGVVTVDASAPVTLTSLGDLMLASTTLTSAVMLDNQGTLSVQGGRSASLNGGLLQSGTVNLVGGTASETMLSVTGGLVNNGVITLGTSADNLASRLTVSGGALVNAGTIQSFTQGGAAANTLDADLHNQSLLDVRHSLSLLGTQTAGNIGTISIASGAALSLASDYANNPTGTIEGSGTLALPGFTLTNAGSLQPGGPSVGTLTIQGDVVMAAGSLDIQIEGTGAGEFDILQVSNNVQLGGTLNVSLPGAYQGVRGDAFAIVTAGAVTGSFATVNLPVDTSMSLSFPGGSVQLAIDTLINRWIAQSGLWTNAGNWSLGTVPTAGDDAIIDVAGSNETVTISAGSNLSVHSLNLFEELLIASSTLSVGNSLIVESGGTLTLADGHVAGAVDNRGGGTVRVTGSSSMSSLVQAGLMRVVGTDTTGSAQLNVDAPMNNSGTIELENSVTGFGATLVVGSIGTEQLVSTGTIRSMGQSAANVNRLRAAVTNQGTMDVQTGLTVTNPSLFDTSNGTLIIPVGQVLTVEGGTVRIGGSPGLGTGGGLFDVSGLATLELARDVTISFGGVQLGLSGAVTITAAQPTTFHNQTHLDLSDDTLAAPVTLENNGSVVLRNTNGDGVLDNLSDADVRATGASHLRRVQQTGTLRVSGADTVGAGQLTVDESIGNSGTIELENSTSGFGATLIVGGGTGQIVNTGTIRSIGQSAANTNRVLAAVDNQGSIDVQRALTVTNPSVFDTSAGTLNILSGQVLTVEGGTVRIGRDPVFDTGGGRLDVSSLATLELTRDVTLAAGDPPLSLSGAVTITAASPTTLTNLSDLDLADDTITAQIVLMNVGQLTLRNTSGGGVIDNQLGGTVQASGASHLGGVLQAGLLRVSGMDTVGNARLAVDAPLPNSGTIELESSANGFGATLEIGIGIGQLTNTGTIRSMGQSAANVNWVQAAVSNQGAIDVQRGLTVTNPSLFDTSAGTLNIAAGQVLTIGGGTVRVGGPNLGTGGGLLDISGVATLELSRDLTLLAGNAQLGLSGTVTITASAPVTLTNQVDLDLSNDTLTAPVTLVNQGQLTLRSTVGDGVLDNRAAGRVLATGINTLGGLVQGGLLRVSGADTVGSGQLTVNAPVSNTGTIELETSPTGFSAALALPGQTLTNTSTGTIVSRSLGATANNNLLSDFINQGMLDVQASLFINAPLASGNAGTINIASGATLSLNHDYTNTSTGVIQGSGTLSLQGLTLTNAGTLRPGPASGTLTIDGNLILTATSILDIDVEGAGAGQFDVIAVSGTAALGGTLNLLLPGAYQGATGDNFKVLTAGSVGGTFATVTAPGAVTVTPVYGATDVVLNLDLASLLNRWIGASGLWTLASNWSLGVPTASQDVEIDVAGVQTITIPTGNNLSVRSLLLAEDLLIDTSTLNVAGNFNINAGATLRLVDATIGGTGAVHNSGTIQVLPGTGSTIARIGSNVGQILVQSNLTTLGQLAVSNGFTNAGTIRLTAGGISSALHVLAGTFTNDGTVISEGNSGGANRLSGVIVNQGTLDAIESLRIDNVGTTFTQGATGDLNIAPGKLVFLNGGALDLQGAMTVDAGGSMRLGGVTANGTAALVNQGTLILDSFNTINTALINQGQLDIPIGGNQLNGALTQAGTITLQASGTGGAFLTVANGFTNDGTIVLATASTGIQPRLTVTSGTLTNNGTIRSQAGGPTGTAGPAEIDAQIVNAGTLQVDYPLALINNNGRVFDSSNGTLAIAAGSVLSVNGGRTRISQNAVNPSLGTLSLAGTSHVLELTSDLTLPNASGWKLDLSNGVVTIDSLVVGGVTLTNLTTLDLGSDTITVNVAVNNQGEITIPGGTGGVVGGALTQTQAGTIRVLASSQGNAFFTASNGFTNDGTIQLQADSAGSAARFTVTNGALTNSPTGVIRSTGPAGATGGNQLNGALINQGLVEVQHGVVLTGPLTTATGSVIRVTPGGVLAVNDGFVNNGTIELQRSATGVAELDIESQTTLVNAGTILSSGTGTGVNALQLKNGRVDGSNNVVLRNLAGGTIQADADLLINHFEGVVEADAGGLDAAAGQTLEFHNYGNATGPNLKLGAGTVFGLGTGTIDVSDGTLVLTSDVTLPAEGAQFKFRGTSVDGAGVTLTNNAALTLNGEAVNVALVNNATILVDGPRFAGSTNFVTLAGGLTANASSTLQIDGGGWLTVNGDWTNAGSIVLNSAVAGTSFDGGNLRTAAGTLTNLGTIHSQSSGGTQFNRIQGTVSNAGQIDAAHDLNIAGALTIPNTASGTVVTGAADLILDGAFTANANGAQTATVGGSGALITNGVSMVNGGQLHLDARRWNNTGAMTITGRLTLDNGAVLSNEAGATLTLAGTNGFPIAQGIGALGAVSNTGTLTKPSTSTATQRIQTTLSNDGDLNVNGGVLELAANGSHSGTFSVNGGELSFVSGTHLIAGAAFTGAGLVRVDGATIDVGAPTAVANPFTLQTGAVTGAGDLTLNGPFTLGGGALSGTGLLTTRGATTENNGAAVIDGRTWNNFGAIVVNGRINLANGGSIINMPSGSLEFSAANTNPTPVLAGVGGGRFVNQGVVTKSNTIAQTLDAAFDNAGTVRVNDGALQLVRDGAHSGAFDVAAAGASIEFTGGVHTLTTGAGFTGPGSARVAGGTVDVAAAPVNATNFAVQSGTLTGAGTLSIRDGFAFTGGAMTGTGLTELGSGIVFAPVNLTVDRNLQVDGTLNLSAGTVTVNAGKTLDVTGVANFAGGTLGGPGNIAMDGTFNWTGGTIGAGGAFTVAGAMNTVGGSARVLDGRTLHATGTIAWDGTGSLMLANGATFDNDAAMTVSNDFQIIGGAGTNQFVNADSFTKSGGAGTALISAPFVNSGRVDVDLGKLSLGAGSSSAGTYEVASGAVLEFGPGLHSVGGTISGSGGVAVIAGSTLTQTGAFSLSGTIVVTGTGSASFAPSGPVNVGSASVTTGTLNFDGVPVTVGSLTNSGGTLGGTGSIAAGNLTWIGGTVRGSGGLAVNGPTNLNGGGKTLDGRTLDLNGTVTWDGSGLLTLTNDAEINNNAAMTVGNDFQIFGAAGANAFVNSGSFTKSGGTGVGSIAVPFTNGGAVNVDAGTLRLSSFPGNSGRMTIAAGTTLSTNGQPLRNASSGIISGAGTMDLGGATLTNAGTLSPGPSAAALHLLGNLTLMPTSVLAMEVEGPAAGQFDFLDVSGEASLGGALNVVLPGAYRGGVSDSFPLIIATATRGAFASISAPAYMTLVPHYGSPQLTLSIDAMTNRWNASSGLWTLGSNWALGRAPAAREDVVIDPGAAVIVPDGTSVNVGSVTVSGGSLELLGAATIAAGTQLRVSGGTVSSAGSLNNAGAVRVSAGSLQAANLTNSGTLDVTGGSVVTSGMLTNRGTLNLSGGTFTRSAGAPFGNSGTVNLSNLALNLDGGDGGVGGGIYSVGPAASLQFSGGNYGIGSLANATGGIVAVSGGMVTVGAVNNSGILNLNGANFARSAGMVFGNAGTVNLNSGSLSLDAGDGGTGGGAYNLGAPDTNLRFTDGSYGVRSITGSGSLEVEGVNHQAMLLSSDTMRIAVQKLNVKAGAFAAVIDPPELVLDVPGGVTLTGGSAPGASAMIQGSSVTLTTSTITLTGGTGSGSYAAIDAVSGGTTIIASGKVELIAGAGVSSGAWISAAGPLGITALSCNGCDLLATNPSQSTASTAGLFGNPVRLTLPPDLVQVPSSVIVGVQTAQGGGEGDAVLSNEEEEDKQAENDNAQSAAGGAGEEHKGERPRQVCM